MNVIPMKIQQASASGINDVAPFAFFEDIQTGCRKGLVQENLIILLQDFLRLLIDVMERPLLTQGTDVDVPL